MSSGLASPEAIALLLRALVLDVFDEQDPARRAEAIGRIFAEDVHFVDPGGAHDGIDRIEPAVIALQARLQGYRFRLTSEPQVSADAGRVTWAFGPPAEPAKVTGVDVVLVRNGRVSVLLTFLDPPAGRSTSNELQEGPAQ